MDRKKILVVDDEEIVRNLLKRVLERENYEVRTAAGGRTAMEGVYAFAPDLLILDVNMPEMDGWQVCTEIRKDPLYHNLPVIFLTVLADKEDKIKGLELGSDDYLTKPVDIEELAVRVRVVLRRATTDSR